MGTDLTPFSNLANWLLGSAMERLGIYRDFIVNTKTSSRVLSTVLLGRIANMFSDLKLPAGELKRAVLDLGRYFRGINRGESCAAGS